MIALTPRAISQSLVPSSVEAFDGAVRVVFPTTPGMLYRIEHTNDLESWTLYPDPIYGLGQTMHYRTYDLPPSPGQAAPPPQSGPQPSENLFFLVTGFDDGSAVASWSGLDGSSQKAYLPSFDLRYQGAVMQEMISGTIVPTSDVPYRLQVWSFQTVKDPAVESIQTAPTETAMLSKLSSEYQWVYDEMKAQVDWRAANPGAPPSHPPLFDDRGQPLHQFFRVQAYETDSNLDGIHDHLQFGNNGGNGDPFDNDIDGDGIPNGYDADLWPAAQFPQTNALLSNVLINEALLTNEFTNCDEDGECSDWIELYNPTNAAVDLTGWFLSDSSGPNGRMMWSFPPGTSIGSGQFLVVWATSKDRGGVEDVNGNGILDPGEDFNNNGILDVPTPIHTNYKLAASQPEPVVLSRPNPGGTAIIVDRIEVGITQNYGTQRTDFSFGRFPSSTGLQNGYMVLPTPGEPGSVAGGSLGPVGQHNVTGALGFTDPPTFAAISNRPGIYENTDVSAVIIPPPTGGSVHFTTNSAHPSRYSELYSGPITTDHTTIVRAIAAREGYIPSTSITRSFLFKEDVLGTSPQGSTPTDHQGARDTGGQFTGLLRGYPELTEANNLPILYAMNADAVAAHKNTLLTELDAAPIVSLVSTVPEFFEVATGGLYPNSGQTERPPFTDPRGREWERACSFEIIEPNGGIFTQANAAVLITGASSIQQSTTRKHNLRIKFEDVYGPQSLVYPLFPGVGTPEYFNFNLKNTTQDSWSNTWNPGSDIRSPATYCNEAFVVETHREMGHEAPHQRWSHLFINGIYWGPYLITERVDDDFMDAHYGQGDYTIVKQGGEAIDGDYAEWQALEILVNSFPGTPAAGKPGIYTQINAQVDLANYVDYLLAYTFAQASDWPGNNHRMAIRRNTPGAQWQFVVWDAEDSLRQGTQIASPVGPGSISAGEGVAVIHAQLKDYQPYRDFFSERVNRAFALDPNDPGSGALILATAQARFQAAMNRFHDVVFCESTRWGDMAKAVPFSKSDPNYLPNDPDKGDWDRSTNYILNTWLPARQAPFLNALQGANLYLPTP